MAIFFTPPPPGPSSRPRIGLVGARDTIEQKSETVVAIGLGVARLDGGFGGQPAGIVPNLHRLLDLLDNGIGSLLVAPSDPEQEAPDRSATAREATVRNIRSGLRRAHSAAAQESHGDANPLRHHMLSAEAGGQEDPRDRAHHVNRPLAKGVQALPGHRLGSECAR